MSINISFTDLRLADTLKQYNSIQLLSPSMDGLVKDVLVQLGFDVVQVIEYVPSKHRTLTSKIVIDFQAVGEMSRDKKYKHLLDTTQRTVRAGYSDISLAREMAALQGVKNTYRNPDDKWNDGSRAKPDDERYYSSEQLLALGWTEGSDAEDYEGSSEYLEVDWESNARAIKELQELHDIIRKGL